MCPLGVGVSLVGACPRLGGVTSWTCALCVGVSSVGVCPPCGGVPRCGRVPGVGVSLAWGRVLGHVLSVGACPQCGRVPDVGACPLGHVPLGVSTHAHAGLIQ